MKRIVIVASLALLASPAFSQQMMGPAFNLTPETRAIWAEQSRQIEAQMERDNAWKHTPSPEYLARQERSIEQAREVIGRRLRKAWLDGERK